MHVFFIQKREAESGCPGQWDSVTGQDIVALHLYKILVLLDFDENNKYLNIKDMQQNTHKKTPHRCTNFFLLGAIKSGGNDKLWYGEPKKTSEY